MGYQASEPTEQRRKIAVAIIGAGYSGLCALRHFSADPRYSVTAFDQSSQIGGIWNYPDGCEDHPNAEETSPFYTRMYKNMITNLPKDLMTLEGYPWSKVDGYASYCSVSKVQDYLNGYVKHNNLAPFIKLNHRVIQASPVVQTSQTKLGPKWLVQAKNLATDEIISDIYDSVIVCNGKCNKPYFPTIPGLSNFKGTLTHSCEYRNPERFRSQVVLVIGGGASARDITLDVLKCAKKVILSQRNPALLVNDEFSPDRLVRTTSIAEYHADRIILSDGSSEHCDAVILATGYLFDYPFLSESCHMNITRTHVAPLYRHMIHCEYPTLAFIFVVRLVTITPVIDMQVKYFKALLDGTAKLPSREEMLADTARDYEERRKKGSSEGEEHSGLGHGLAGRNWTYMTALARDGGFKSYDHVIPKMCAASLNWIQNATNAYKSYRLEKIDSENYFADEKVYRQT